MFFVVRSNDSFNFPLGLIKYIVIVIVNSITTEVLWRDGPTLRTVGVASEFCRRSTLSMTTNVRLGHRAKVSLQLVNVIKTLRAWQTLWGQRWGGEDSQHWKISVCVCGRYMSTLAEIPCLFSDADECASDNGLCEDACVNTPGSFVCLCTRLGYVLAPDNSSCVGKIKLAYPIEKWICCPVTQQDTPQILCIPSVKMKTLAHALSLSVLRSNGIPIPFRHPTHSVFLCFQNCVKNALYI